ncbi:MAG: biopolymer transporter ExbD [Tateyamaria sp.]|uniref:ExbD/TolR family protein n=1 Tax=Tateyamaria sp. TaxID=1929288 RepID=UPI0032DCCC51
MINTVFLMLIFFMVAGTLSPPLDRDIALVNTKDLEARPPPDALVIHADGQLSFRGRAQSDAKAYMRTKDPQAKEVVKIVPDRNLLAFEMIAVGRALRTAGAASVVIVSERGLE